MFKHYEYESSAFTIGTTDSVIFWFGKWNIPLYCCWRYRCHFDLCLL